MLYFNLLENIYPLQNGEGNNKKTKTFRNVEAIDVGGYLYRRDRSQKLQYCRDV